MPDAGCRQQPIDRHRWQFELEQLAAVAETLGSEPFDLIGTSMGALVAVAWAAAHPETVRRLVLYGGWVSGADISPPSARDHVLGLVESHWGLGSDVLTEIFAPDADRVGTEGVRPLPAGQLDRSHRPGTAGAELRPSTSATCSRWCARRRWWSTAPTTALHPVAQAEALAQGIAGAQLVVLPGRSHLPYSGDADAVVAAIRRFLGLRSLPRSPRALTPRQTEVAALITDGCTNREIAARLGIDERSAEGHVERIRLRLGFSTRAQIAGWYASRRNDPVR